MAVVKGLEEKIGNAGKWIHFGATSYDIVDTARALQHKNAISLLEIAINKLICLDHRFCRKSARHLGVVIYYHT